MLNTTVSDNNDSSWQLMSDNKSILRIHYDRGEAHPC